MSVPTTTGAGEAAVALLGVRKTYGRNGSAVRALDTVDVRFERGIKLLRGRQ